MSDTQGARSNQAIDRIWDAFIAAVGGLGFELSKEDVQARRSGSASLLDDDYQRGDTVRYVFGRDDRGEYLDYFIADRMGGDVHRRIRHDGTEERLETVPPGRPSSADAVEDARLEAEYQVRVSGIYERLRAKGFEPS